MPLHHSSPSRITPTMQSDFGRHLPLELAQTLNEAYFLHLLAFDPDVVVPAGKSLLSMMTNSRSTPDTASTTEPAAQQLRERVENAFHTAFWKQALEALQSDTPSVQIDRLKGLLSDVREAVLPLFPREHSIIETLSAPLPPTSSPLLSTVSLLKETLVALRQRAAPIRDPTIDALLMSLDNPSSEVPQLVLDTIRSILLLSETMKADLNQFVLGSFTETQLRDVVTRQAKQRGKELVLAIWKENEQDGLEHIQTLWQTWVDDSETEASLEPRDKWINRLVHALGSTKPVSCLIPGAPQDPARADNQLPPHFFFMTPRLLYAQNYLQALVLAAALRSLTRLPLPSVDTAGGNDFMMRVWALLKAEIDDEVPSATGTKILNLADEVLRARRLHSVCDEEEEAQLRAAVDRTLRYSDPVFLLLQKRLLEGIARQLCQPKRSSEVPERLRTGRQALETSQRAETSGGLYPMGIIKGFEEPVLRRGIEEITDKLSRYIDWVEDVWHVS
ncbi:hypothetical protein R3P38DRAFT_1161259 [Favolaschia claudopus]|uniref:Uncharacterized protein n=1 Tax=Favolaschia claudopus TaxID=2862362 RepID=A0AAW0DV77_9AGAR